MSGATEYYSGVAAEFHRSYEADPNRLDRLTVWRKVLDRYAGGCGLAYDLGCGSGMITRELALRVPRVIAIDGAAGMLAIASQTLSHVGVTNVEFLEACFPLPDNSGLLPAQLVISSSALEYTDSLPDSLAFAASLLLPRGALIFSMSNRRSISRNIVRQVHRTCGKPAYLDHLRHFVTVQELQSHLPAAHLEYVEHAFFGGADWMNRFLALLAPTSRTSNMILMVARRT